MTIFLKLDIKKIKEIGFNENMKVNHHENQPTYDPLNDIRDR
mgnify:CR=1 FL=1